MPTQDPRAPLPRARAQLVLLCLALWLPGFFSLPPGDRDESRFAQATKQMNETGDYVRIMNGTEPRNRKPIGIYWLQAPFALMAGPNLENPIWPYRVPSLLGGILAVLATFEAGLVLTPNRRTAALGAAMLAASVLLTTETHIAKTDAALLGATTLAMALLARAWRGAAMATWQAALFWVATGAGILLKGPITPMVLGLATATICLWERRARWLAALRPGWGVPLMLVSVLPWFVAIERATGGRFLADAIGGDLGQKLAGGAEAHGAPPGLHLLLIPLLAFPSSLSVVAALPAAWIRRDQAAIRFLTAWVVPAWLVFEIVPTKLPHYTLPLYPALFLLAASTLDTKLPLGWARHLGRTGLVLAAAALAAGAAALPSWLGGPWWLGLPGLLAVTIAAMLAWRGRVVVTLFAVIPVYACILELELPHLPGLWIGPRVVAALRHDWPGWNAQGRGLVVAGYAEPSLVFLSGTQTRLLPDGAQAAARLADGTADIVLMADTETLRFMAAAHDRGLTPRLRDSVRGYNPSRGRWLTLDVFIR